jgi:hypothetical protein
VSTARAAHRVYKGVTFEEYAFARRRPGSPLLPAGVAYN